MRIILSTILFLFSLLIQGQDIHFSQYQEMPLQYNPALAGNSSSTKRAGLIYRNQWNSVTSPFESTGVFGDIKLQHEKLNGANIGLGLLVLNDRSGSVGWQENHFSVSANYQRFINKKQSLLISAGPRIGFFQLGFDPSKLNFESDFAYQSASFITNGNLENFGSGKISRSGLDLGLGVSLTKYSKSGLESVVGISSSHFSIANVGFQGSGVFKPNLVNVHASTEQAVNKVLKVKPSFLYMQQQDATMLVVGGQFIYSLGNRLVEETDLKAGIYLRTSDALFFTFGINHDNWGINMAYDHTISGLQQASVTVNSFEIAITIKNKIFKSKTRRFILPGNRLL